MDVVDGIHQGDIMETVEVIEVNLMNDVSIKHPEWLYIDVDGKTSYGYDQEWFTDEWQRLSGCGPTSASQVLGYSLFRDGLLDLETTSDQTLAFRTDELSLEICKATLRWWCL